METPFMGIQQETMKRTHKASIGSFISLGTFLKKKKSIWNPMTHMGRHCDICEVLSRSVGTLGQNGIRLIHFSSSHFAINCHLQNSSFRKGNDSKCIWLPTDLELFSIL